MPAGEREHKALSFGLAHRPPCFSPTVCVSLVKGLIALCLSFPLSRVELVMVYPESSSTVPGTW